MFAKKIKSFEYKGSIYLVKPITEKELKSIEKKSIIVRYNKMLALIINKKLCINDFNGRLKELSELIDNIRRIIINGN